MPDLATKNAEALCDSACAAIWKLPFALQIGQFDNERSSSATTMGNCEICMCVILASCGKDRSSPTYCAD